MNHKLEKGLASLIGLSVVAIVGNAAAGNDKVFNGTFCTFATAGQYNGQQRLGARLKNTSAATQVVSCPLKRDETTDVVHEAYIIGSANIDEDTCYFWEREDDTSYQYWTHSHVESTNVSINKTTFSYGSSFISPDDFASLQITCEVPSGASIYSYWLWEN